MGVGCLTSQFTVKFASVWKPSFEKLVDLTRGTNIAKTIENSNDKSNTKRKADKALVAAEKKKRRKQKAQERKNEEANWSDDSDCEDYLEKSSALVAGQSKQDIWGELIWRMATSRIDNIHNRCEAQVLNDEDGSSGKTKKNLPVYDKKKQILDKRFVNLSEQGEQLALTPAETRGVFDDIWHTVEGDFSMEHHDFIREHLWMWKTCAGFLKATSWEEHLLPSGDGNDDVGAARTRWIVQRFLSLFESKRSDTYTRALTARLVHCLETVSQIPSFDRLCPRVMVRRVIETCGTWMIMESETDIQKHALKCLLHCQDIAPNLSQYQESFQGIISETDFRDSMLRLSLDPESGTIKPEHRDRVVPLVLRVLFSKLIKKSKKLDKKGNQKHSRRAAVFSAFGGLKSDELHHLLAVMLQGVLTFRRVVDGERKFHRHR